MRRLVRFVQKLIVTLANFDDFKRAYYVRQLIDIPFRRLILLLVTFLVSSMSFLLALLLSYTFRFPLIAIICVSVGLFISSALLLWGYLSRKKLWYVLPPMDQVWYIERYDARYDEKDFVKTKFIKYAGGKKIPLALYDKAKFFRQNAFIFLPEQLFSKIPTHNPTISVDISVKAIFEFDPFQQPISDEAITKIVNKGETWLSGTETLKNLLEGIIEPIIRTKTDAEIFSVYSTEAEGIAEYMDVQGEITKKLTDHPVLKNRFLRPVGVIYKPRWAEEMKNHILRAGIAFAYDKAFELAEQSGRVDKLLVYEAIRLEQMSKLKISGRQSQVSGAVFELPQAIVEIIKPTPIQQSPAETLHSGSESMRLLPNVTKVETSSKEEIIDAEFTEVIERISLLCIEDQRGMWKMLQTIVENRGWLFASADTKVKALELLYRGDNVYHILLIDINLDPSNFEDEGGIEILRMLELTGQIFSYKISVLSSRRDKEETVLREFGIDFFPKQNIEKLQIVDAYLSKLARQLEIDFTLSIGEDLSARGTTVPVQAHLKWIADSVVVWNGMHEPYLPSTKRLISEIELLLRKMYYVPERSTSMEIYVERSLEGMRNGFITVHCSLKGVEQPSEIVRIGYWPLIEHEIHQFNEYMANPSELVRVVRYARTAWLGGVTWLSTPAHNYQDVLTLSQFIKRGDVNAINQIIRILYTEKLGGLYSSYENKRRNLLDVLQSELGLDYDRVQYWVNHHTYCDALNRITLPNNPDHPWHFPFQEVFTRYNGMSSRGIMKVHGNVNTSTVLLDAQHHVLLLDFLKSGHKNPLYDFVRLEVDIKLRSYANLRVEQYIEIETAIINEQWELLETYIGDARLLFGIVEHLRKLTRNTDAYQYKTYNLAEYNLVLLFHTFDLMMQSEIEIYVQERAFVSASLLMEKLLE